MPLVFFSVGFHNKELIYISLKTVTFPNPFYKGKFSISRFCGNIKRLGIIFSTGYDKANYKQINIPKLRNADMDPVIFKCYLNFGF